MCGCVLCFSHSGVCVDDRQQEEKEKEEETKMNRGGRGGVIVCICMTVCVHMLQRWKKIDKRMSEK